MSGDANKALYRRWLLGLWNGDLSLADELVGSGFVIHQARLGSRSEDARGPEALAQMVQQGRDPFAGLTFRIDVGPLTDGDFVVARWTGHGAYKGGRIPGANAPQGTEVRFSGIDILRVASGKFVEYWVCSDDLSLMAQLGAFPTA
jgi:predicted ester cyclase